MSAVSNHQFCYKILLPLISRISPQYRLNLAILPMTCWQYRVSWLPIRDSIINFIENEFNYDYF